jgi:uncharacterized protein YbaR (Trm112 family)
MSDDCIKLIPTDPCYVPPKPLQKKAIDLLEVMLPEGEECEAEVYERLTFIDQGENLSFIICPNCRKNLDYNYDENIQEWWYSIEAQEQDKGVEGLMISMPCCKRNILFTDLTFDSPAGFARFKLVAWNPQISHDLSPEQIADLEAVLKCKLKQIRAYY